MRIALLLARQLPIAPVSLLRCYLHWPSWPGLVDDGGADALYASPPRVCGGVNAIGLIAITSVTCCPCSCTITRPSGSPVATGPLIAGGTSYTSLTDCASAFGITTLRSLAATG